MREGRRASTNGSWQFGGPHSVALQTLTKYASEAFCLFVVVPSCAVRNQKPHPVSGGVALRKKTRVHLDRGEPPQDLGNVKL